MNNFEVWIEGYLTNGNRGEARKIGEHVAETFEDACSLAVHEFFKDDPNFPIYWSPKRLSYWGCKLYNNEADAHKSFG